MDNVQTLIDCIAGAIVAAHGSGGRWKLDLPRIAAVGEALGVREIDEAAITDRLVALSMMLPTPEDADDAAANLLGPNGSLAPGFLASA